MYNQFFARQNPPASADKTEPRELPWLPVVVVVGVLAIVSVSQMLSFVDYWRGART